jgi:hypothetical protein
MARKREHQKVGAVTGAVVAFLQASDQAWHEMVLETIGGMVGGHLGGCLPDVLEPATWPGHRQFAHSATCTASLLQGATFVAEPWRDHWRVLADQFLAAARGEHDPAQQLILGLQAMTARLLAGFSLVLLLAKHPTSSLTFRRVLCRGSEA